MISVDEHSQEGFETIELQEFNSKANMIEEEADIVEPFVGQSESTERTNRQPQQPANFYAATRLYWPYYANTFKAFFGSNYLSISFAFVQSGYVLGAVSLAGIAFITGHGCHLLVSSKRILEARRASEVVSTSRKVDSIKYGTLGEYAWGTPGRVTVEVSLLLTQYGFCSGYIVFLGDTLESLIDYGGWDVDLENESFQLYCLWAPVVVIVALCMIRDVSSLGWTSMVATVTLSSGALVILGNTLASAESLPPSDAVPWKFGTFPVFFGIVVSAFEGIGVMLPIQQSLVDSGIQSHYSTMFGRVLTAVTVLLGSFGLIHYVLHGSGTPQIILHTIPEGSNLGMVVRISLFGGILLGVPLQMVPIFEIFERQAIRWCCGYHKNADYSMLQGPRGDTTLFSEEGVGRSNETESSLGEPDAPQPESLAPLELGGFARALVRTVAVIVAAVVATIARHDFGFIGAIVGSTGGVLLAFVFPALLDVRLNKENLSSAVYAKDLAMVAFGLAGGVVGLYMSIVRLEEVG